jgi:hypothetical protein
MKNIQYGGLALRNPDNYTGNDTEKYEKALFDMIKQATAIECISYSSLEGFIFTLKVNEEDAVFNGLNEESKFEKPITKVLLKLVLIKRHDSQTNKFNIKTGDKIIKKRATAIKMFNNEINTQYKLYKKTLEYNNVPICPSIIYHNIIDMRNKIIPFISNLKRKDEQSVITTTIINQLVGIYKQEQNIPILGIIGMEFADGYQTLDSYKEDTEKSYEDGSITQANDMYQLGTCEADCKCMADIMVNIIRLFISSGIIHIDLHSNNIMLNKNLSKSEIIDFGMIMKMTIKQNNREYYTYENLIFDKEIKKPYVETLENYLYINLGSASKYIGNEEQLFIQEYLYDIRSDDERCKKIIKLFLLIVIGERQLRYITLKEPNTQMFHFLEILGLTIILDSFDSNMNIDMDILNFDIDSLDDKNITLKQWIDKNIKPLLRSFFMNVIMQVYGTFKEYYELQDFTNNTSVDNNIVSVFRIGTYDIDKYKDVASKYTYGRGPSKKVKKIKRTTKRKRSRKNRRKHS